MTQLTAKPLTARPLTARALGEVDGASPWGLGAIGSWLNSGSGGSDVALERGRADEIKVWSGVGGNSYVCCVFDAGSEGRLSWRRTDFVANLRKIYPFGDMTLNGTWNQQQSSGVGIISSYVGNRSGVATIASSRTAEIEVAGSGTYDLWVAFTGRTSGAYCRVDIDGSQALVNEISDPDSLGFKAFSTFTVTDLQYRQWKKVASGLTGTHTVLLTHGGDDGGNQLRIEAVGVDANLSDERIMPPEWQPSTPYTAGDEVQLNGIYYSARSTATSGSGSGPTHTSGIASDGAMEWKADYKSTYQEQITIDYPSEREYALEATIVAKDDIGGQTHENETLISRTIEIDGVEWAREGDFDYFIDADNGDDSNDGESLGAAWASLNKIEPLATNAVSDTTVRVLVKAGTYDTVSDHFELSKFEPVNNFKLDIVFEPGCVMDGTVHGSTAQNPIYVGTSGMAGQTVEIFGNGLTIQNYSGLTGGTPNGIGYGGSATVIARNISITNVIDGISGHQNGVGYFYDITVRNCGKLYIAHVGDSQSYNYRVDVEGVNGTGGFVQTNAGRSEFYDCRFAPADNDQTLLTENAFFKRCQLGTLSARTEIGQFGGMGSNFSVTVEDSFLNLDQESLYPATLTRCFGFFSTRVRDDDGLFIGTPMTVQDCVFSGPASGRSNTVYSNFNDGDSRPLQFSNNIFAGSYTFMSIDANNAGYLAAAGSNFDNNLLTDGKVYDSDLIAADDGSVITNTATGSADVGSADSLLMSDYATTRTDIGFTFAESARRAVTTPITAGSKITIVEDLDWTHVNDASLASVSFSRVFTPGVFTHDLTATIETATVDLGYFYPLMMPLVRWDGEYEVDCFTNLEFDSGAAIDLDAFAGSVGADQNRDDARACRASGNINGVDLYYGAGTSLASVDNYDAANSRFFVKPNIGGGGALGSTDWAIKAYAARNLNDANSTTYVNGETVSFKSRHKVSIFV